MFAHDASIIQTIVQQGYITGEQKTGFPAEQKGIAQANRYAATEVVHRHVGHTQLHKIVVVFHGVDMAVCEEV